MRGDYHSSWMALTPTEALEMAEQLASACGVKIAMRPKNDFSSLIRLGVNSLFTSFIWLCE